MLYDHNSALAPTPADPNAASTGDEADPRDKVSTATAEMLSVAHDPPPHAHEQACNPSGNSPSNLLSEPAAYSTSDPMGRSQRDCARTRQANGITSLSPKSSGHTHTITLPLQCTLQLQ